MRPKRQCAAVRGKQGLHMSPPLSLALNTTHKNGLCVYPSSYSAPLAEQLDLKLQGSARRDGAAAGAALSVRERGGDDEQALAALLIIII